MEGQSSTSRSGWGHHRGPVSTGGVFSSGGNWNSFVCFPPNLSVLQTVKIPTPTPGILTVKFICLHSIGHRSIVPDDIQCVIAAASLNEWMRAFVYRSVICSCSKEWEWWSGWYPWINPPTLPPHLPFYWFSWKCGSCLVSAWFQSRFFYSYNQGLRTCNCSSGQIPNLVDLFLDELVADFNQTFC